MINSIYIFGAGTNGEQCLANCRKHGIEVAAFLDNFTEKYEFNNCPVLRPAQADRETTVVVTSPVHCLDITLQLDWLGFKHVLNLSEFYHDLGLEPDWAGDLGKNRKEYERARAMLGDYRSMCVFDAVVKFRKTLQPLYPAATRTDLRHQWFDREFFPLGSHVYVDGGAYNGDTAEEFIRQCPEYRSVHLFEPCQALAQEAEKRLAGHRSVHVTNAGLWSTELVTHLENAGLPSGKIGGHGEAVSLVSLDRCLPEPPTFIKLDVEGSEKAALLGAEGHIRRSKPFLAIAVYHRPQDIWELPQLLAGMRDYKFYLRHYTQFYHETVLYAI